MLHNRRSVSRNCHSEQRGDPVGVRRLQFTIIVVLRRDVRVLCSLLAFNDIFSLLKQTGCSDGALRSLSVEVLNNRTVLS